MDSGLGVVVKLNIFVKDFKRGDHQVLAHERNQKGLGLDRIRD